MGEKHKSVVDIESGWSSSDYGVTRNNVKFGYRNDDLLLSFSGRHGPFKSVHTHASGGGMSFQDDSFVCGNNPCGWVHGENYNPIKSNTGNPVPSIDWASTELFARSRPDSKIFDFPRAIGELKDLPGMLQGIRRSFLDKGVAYTVGHLNLSYKFGWEALFSDVAKTFQLTESIDKRFKQLKRQSETGSVIRKVQLYQGTNANSYDLDHERWHMTVSNQLSDRMWGYTIWRTSSSFPQTDADLLALAQSSAAGLGGSNLLTDYGEAAWNLIPWTWATDWFLNVGTYLEACRNTDDWGCSVGNICHETTFTATARSTGLIHEDKPGDITPLHFERVDKRRFAANAPTITAQFPVLTDSQLGILGSILSTKGRG